MPLLAILGDMINAPILIATSKFCKDAHHEAICNGACFYGQYFDNPEKNIVNAIAIVDSYQRIKKQKTYTRAVNYGSLLILVEHKMVFCNGTEIVLTLKEFGVLLYLLENRNMTISNGQIAKKVWGSEDVSDESIRQVIDKLRKKFSNNGYHDATIVNFKKMGYRFKNKSASLKW